MAKLSKYSKLRPKVSVLTFIIIGLVFIALTAAIVLSIDTPKQKFEKLYGLDKDHVFELSTLKKVDKKIDSAEDILVLFKVDEEPVEGQEPSNLFVRILSEVINLTSDDKDDAYSKLTEEELANFSKVYIVTISTKEKDQEAFSDFLEKHEEIKENRAKGMLIRFNETRAVNEFANKEVEGLDSGVESRATLIRNLKKFIEEL